MELTLDTRVIRRLADEIGSAREAHAFLAGFAALLGDRISRIEVVLAGSDVDAHVLAVMSLQTSAVQVGAFRLGSLARALLELEDGRPRNLVLEDLRVEAESFRSEAAAFLSTQSSTGHPAFSTAS